MYHEYIKDGFSASGKADWGNQGRREGVTRRERGRERWREGGKERGEERGWGEVRTYRGRDRENDGERAGGRQVRR